MNKPLTDIVVGAVGSLIVGVATIRNPTAPTIGNKKKHHLQLRVSTKPLKKTALYTGDYNPFI